MKKKRSLTKEKKKVLNQIKVPFLLILVATSEESGREHFIQLVKQEGRHHSGRYFYCYLYKDDVEPVLGEHYARFQERLKRPHHQNAQDHQSSSDRNGHNLPPQVREHGEDEEDEENRDISPPRKHSIEEEEDNDDDDDNSSPLPKRPKHT